MEEWVVKFLEFIGASGVIGGLLLYIGKKVVDRVENSLDAQKIENNKVQEEQQQVNTALKKGVQALLRAEMISKYNKYIKLGYAPIYEKENFHNVYTQYHSLGENGVMDKIYESFMALPTEPPESE